MCGLQFPTTERVQLIIEIGRPVVTQTKCFDILCGITVTFSPTCCSDEAFGPVEHAGDTLMGLRLTGIKNIWDIYIYIYIKKNIYINICIHTVIGRNDMWKKTTFDAAIFKESSA